MKKIGVDVVVLGGGFSGLAGAKMLRGFGKSVLVLEKCAYPGGLARTLKYKDFRFDIGGHRLNFSTDDHETYFKSLLNEKLLKIKKNSKIFTKGIWVNYPPDLQSCFKFFKKHRFKLVAELIKKKERQGIESFKEWIICNFGETIYSLYFEEYTKKVWGMDGSNLSWGWADKRIGVMNFWKFLKNIFGHTEDSIEMMTTFYYPQRGIGTIIDKLSEGDNRSFDLMVDSEVRSIKTESDYIKSLFFIHDGQEWEVEAGAFVSSIPVVDMLSLLGFSGSGGKETIRYRSLITINLIIDIPQLCKEHWRYYPDQDIIFSRIHEPKNWSKLMVSDQSKTSLCIELFCDENDSLWNSPDELLWERVSSDLNRLEIVKKQQIKDYFIERIPNAYPLYYLGCERPLNKYLQSLEKFQNLFLIGRTGTHAYFDMEECLKNINEIIPNVLNIKE